jgi:phosphoglycolate phosphatase
MGKRMLVCDLDNTLYDWVGYFVSAFYAMVDEMVATTGCDRERLLDDFRDIHRYHEDSEHPFSLLETATVRDLLKQKEDSQITKNIDRAFYAFNSARKRNLYLYKDVRETLNILQKNGVILVAHTESKLYAVVDRLIRLDLTGYFTAIYCRQRSESRHPNPEIGRSWLDRFPMDRVVELSRHQRKPDPDVLREICQNEGVSTEDSAYIGDSLARDVLMAKKAGVFAIWARYGAHNDSDAYRKLIRISHWTQEDIERELSLRKQAEEISADLIVENSFNEILSSLA